METDRYGRIAEDLPFPEPYDQRAKDRYEERWLEGIKQAALDRKAKDKEAKAEKAKAVPLKPSTKPVVKVKAPTKRSRQCSSPT